jgi:hypothetical protein
MARCTAKPRSVATAIALLRNGHSDVRNLKPMPSCRRNVRWSAKVEKQRYLVVTLCSLDSSKTALISSLTIILRQVREWILHPRRAR